MGYDNSQLRKVTEEEGERGRYEGDGRAARRSDPEDVSTTNFALSNVRRSDPGTIRQQASIAKIRPWDVSTTGNKSEDPTLGRFDNRDHLTSDNVSYLETLFRECTFRYLHIR